MAKDFNMKEAYNKLKHKLPDFNEIDDEFEISFIDYKLEDDKFLLRSIRRKMNEKIIFYCRIIEGVLYPHQANIISMMEGNMFDEEEKKRVQELYKKLMFYERDSLKLDVIADEKKNVEFINNIFGLWREHNKEMKWVVEKMQKGWMQEEKKEGGSYLG